MKQNILNVAVTAAPETDGAALSAGKMYEHNATAVCFLMDESLILPEYRYYVEFVTVSGTARTQYLTPDAQNQITVELPIEITAQMTALCVLNIVKVAENGKTEQVIKAKTVRLYFSSLENTDRLIDEEHAFSVNQLLEAIRQNTFKGEKGEKGDAYLLTDADRTEIAAQMNEAFYGLPLEMDYTLSKTTPLGGAQQTAAVTSLSVSPTAYTPDGISDLKVTLGNNEIEWLLVPENYAVFPPAESNYTNLPIALKPNTAYVLSKLSDEMAKSYYSAVVVGGVSYYFCHRATAGSNRKYIDFTTGDDGLVTLRSTYVYSSQPFYSEVLQTGWQGLTLTELQNSVTLQQHFDTPLYGVSEAYADTFDFVSGVLSRRTAKTALTAECLSAETPLTLTGGIKTAYRYVFSLPAESIPRICGAANGLCASFPTMSYDVTNDAAYKRYVADTAQTTGIYFGIADGTVCVLSTVAPADFTAQLAQTPIEIVYAAAERTETFSPVSVTLPAVPVKAYVSPETVSAHLLCKANISNAMNDLQSRLTALENRI